MRLTSDQGRGRFRLLLRLDDPARYQIRATHPLFNQRLWTLDVDGGQAVLVDFHQHVVCRYQGAAEIGAIPLGPFPFESLPALLLGYLPLPPVQTPERPAPGLLAFSDASGRRWTATLDRDLVERFEVAGEETVTWERGADGWYVLAAAADNLDLRWKDDAARAARRADGGDRSPARLRRGSLRPRLAHRGRGRPARRVSGAARTTRRAHAGGNFYNVTDPPVHRLGP